jgi:hypothetical protein
MEKRGQQSLIIFCACAIASVGLYLVSYMDHLTAARLAAFIALFLSILTFVVSYRAGSTAQKVNLQAKVSIWANIIAGGLYLLLSGWRP